MPFTYLFLSPVFVCLAGVLQSHKTKPWLNMHFCSPGENLRSSKTFLVQKLQRSYHTITSV